VVLLPRRLPADFRPVPDFPTSCQLDGE